MLKSYLFLLSLWITLPVQEPDMWQVLSEVGFETHPSREKGYEIDTPKFSKRLLSYQNKKVRIKGYLVPLTESGGKNQYMLSALPFNQCYFCGGAGPETVVELQTSHSIRFVTRQITMEGTLLLNDSDPDHHMYILKDARILD
jgi:hypothetical protein